MKRQAQKPEQNGNHIQKFRILLCTWYLNRLKVTAFRRTTEFCAILHKFSRIAWVQHWVFEIWLFHMKGNQKVIRVTLAFICWVIYTWRKFCLLVKSTNFHSTFSKHQGGSGTLWLVEFNLSTRKKTIFVPFIIIPESTINKMSGVKNSLWSS